MATKDYSSIQENRIANALNWKVVPGSGARPMNVGDVVSDNWVGECKTHVEPGHKIVFKFDVWRKIFEEAASCFKQPVMFVDDGSQLLDNTWCLFAPHGYYGEFLLVDYPYTIRSNILFESGALYKHMKSQSAVYPVIYQVVLSKSVAETVHLCHFSSFLKLFNRGE